MTLALLVYISSSRPFHPQAPTYAHPPPFASSPAAPSRTDSCRGAMVGCANSGVCVCVCRNAPRVCCVCVCVGLCVWL